MSDDENKRIICRLSFCTYLNAAIGSRGDTITLWN